MAVNETKREALERLVTTIGRSGGKGSWRISLDDLADTLGLDLVELYRTIDENPRGIRFGESIEGFDESRVGELITLLEALAYPGVEEMFFRAGLFVPLQAGSRLTEALLARYVRELRQHEVVWEQVSHGLQRGRSYREVARVYLAERLPMEPVSEEVVAGFLRAEGLPAQGRETLLRYIGTLRERHVLDYAVLGAPFYEEVYRYAVAEGYIKPREQEYYWAGRDEKRAGRSGNRGRGNSAGRSHSWARSLLGVSAGEGREAICRAYRKEMLRYHPDVNPSGAEIAKELNAAYATLLGDIGGSR